jgi:ABC-type amino acid transport substrate-binding protein
MYLVFSPFMKRPFLFLQAVLLLTLGSAFPQVADSSSPTPAVSQSASPTPRKIVAGVYINQPFAFQTAEGYEGFCVDLWKQIAADLGVSTEYVPFGTIDGLLKATADNKVDVALGNISITEERGKIVDFSQPYLQGGMQIMIDEKRGSSWQHLWNGLRDSGHLKVFEIGIAVILLGTLILTLCERHWNKEFHPDWKNGLAESFYHVMSIAMTGKSTHKGLPGPMGKILAGIWLAFGVGVVAYITSSVTSVMTVNRLKGMIDGPQDLPGHHVGAIHGTLAEHYCEEQNLYTSLYPNLPDAVQALVRHEIDAIVFDAMTLQWYDNAHPELPITEVGPIFMKKGYGFAMSLRSALHHDINQALLKAQESGFTETLRKHYFGDIP